MTKSVDWIEKPLGRIASLTMGQSPDSKYYTDDEAAWPFLQGCAEFQARFPAPKLFCSVKQKVAIEGALLFSVRAPVGRINVADREYVVGRGLAAIEGVEVASAYLEQYLSFIAPRFRSASQGSTFEAINSSELANWPITFPSNSCEQSKVAEVLSTVDRAIEETQTLIGKQQRIKIGMMQDLLTRGIDEHGNLRTEKTHKFKDSPLGRVPEEWEVTTLEKLTSQIVDGVHHTPTYVDSGVPFIVITDMTRGAGIDFSNTRFVSEKDHKDYSKRVSPQPGDVLVTKDGTLGVARIVPICAPAFSIFVSVALLRPRLDLCVPELIWTFFESGEFLRQLGSLSAGTGLAHIHLEHFRAFILRRPPMEEQRRICDALIQQEEAIWTCPLA